MLRPLQKKLVLIDFFDISFLLIFHQEQPDSCIGIALTAFVGNWLFIAFDKLSIQLLLLPLLVCCYCLCVISRPFLSGCFVAIDCYLLSSFWLFS